MKDIIEKAEQYKIDATYNSRAHYKAVDLASRRNTIIGVPVVITTSIVATSIFATLNSNPDIKWKLTTGVVSIAAVVLSALQTFFKFSARAEKHRANGVNYSSLRRQIEHFILKYNDVSNDKREQSLVDLEVISQRLSQLAADSIPIPPKAYKLAVKEIKSEAGKIPTSVGRIQGD